MSDYMIIVITTIFINIILAVSLNMINGMTGQFSLGHAGFMAVGAYISAIFVKEFHMSILVGVLFAVIFAAIVGFAVGFPVLRLKGDYLAIVTLGFGEIIRVIIQQMKITGGARGLYGIPSIAGVSGFSSYYGLIAIAGAAVITVIIIRNIMVSSEGRAFISIREDEIAAESMGINLTKYKVLSFVIGAGFAGAAGALYAHTFNTITPSIFNMYKTVDILLMVVLGGMGSLTGSIFAAVALTIVSELLRGFSEYRMIIYSLLLIVLMLIRPNGILGKKELSDIIKFKKRGA